MLNIQNILVEHFHRLKCANFYLLFDTPFADIASVRVHLRPTEINVVLSDTRTVTIALASIAMEIQINSLSLLIVRGNLISFRINTSTCDSFRTEIVPLGGVDENAVTDNTYQLHLNVEPNEDFKIVCDTCSGPLTESLCFRRVLELPSENMDLNEWFCHRPHDSKAAQPEPSHQGQHHHHHDHRCGSSDDTGAKDSNDKYNVTKFTPADGDLLYGNFFLLVQLQKLQNISVDSTSQMIHCRRCFKHVGETIKNQSARIWNGNVRMHRGDVSSRRIFAGASDFMNFLFMVDRIFKDFQMLGRQSQKLLFEAQDFSGVAKFLFIHLMAKTVEIYQMENANESNIDYITLVRIEGTKCLFRCEQNADQALLQFWQNDVNVVSAQLSIEMLECVVDRLEDYSKFVPETYRMNNGFCLSYLCRDRSTNDVDQSN